MLSCRMPGGAAVVAGPAPVSYCVLSKESQ